LVPDQDVIIASQQQPQTYFNEALASLRAGDFSDAASSCNLALEKFPGDANLLCLCARAELAMGQFARAREILEDVTRKHPDFAVAHDVSGDLLFAQGQVGTAVKAYEQAMRLDPTRPGTLKKIEKARQLLTHAPKSGTKPAKESSSSRQMAFAEEMHHADKSSKSGDKKRAEDIYRRILTRDPNHVEAARMLARIAVENDNLKDAEVFLRHALSIAPDYTRLRVDLVNVLSDLHKPDEALECAGTVLELEPDMAESHAIHAVALGANGLHHEAIEAYERALHIAPDRPAILCSLAHHLKTVGEQDQAIARYRESISLKPDHAQSYWSMANLKTFKFDESEIEAMQTLLAKKDLPDNSPAPKSGGVRSS